MGKPVLDHWKKRLSTRVHKWREKKRQEFEWESDCAPESSVIISNKKYKNLLTAPSATVIKLGASLISIRLEWLLSVIMQAYVLKVKQTSQRLYGHRWGYFSIYELVSSIRWYESRIFTVLLASSLFLDSVFYNMATAAWKWTATSQYHSHLVVRHENFTDKYHWISPSWGHGWQHQLLKKLHSTFSV